MIKPLLLLSIISLLASCSQFAWKAKYKQEYLEKKNQELGKQIEEENRKIEEENRRITERNKQIIEKFQNQQDVINAKKNNSKIKVTVVQDNPANHFAMTNNYDIPIKLSYEESALVIGSESHRVVSGETKLIVSSLSTPDLTIPPNTTARFSFYNPKIEQLFDAKGLEELRHSYSKVMIALKVDNKTQYYHHIMQPTKTEPLQEKVSIKDRNADIEDYAEYSTKIKNSDHNWCLVTFIFFGGYCWLIEPSEDEVMDAKKKFMSESGLNENQFDWSYLYKF